MANDVGRIGQSVVIKGDLSAEEDLTIEGQVDGKIELARSVLTVGTGGRIAAQILAKVVIVMGKVNGAITATEAINIRETAAVEGELVAPKVGIEEGAFFRGQVDMRSPKTQKVGAKDTSRDTRTRQQPAKPAVTGPEISMTASSASG